MPKQYKYGSTRKHGRAVFLAFFTFGIYYLLYQWWIFQDLQEHFEKAHKTEPRSMPTLNNPTTMFILLFFFPIYPIFKKYELLHEHIATSPIKTETNCKSAVEAILAWVFLSICTLGIYPFIMERKWQKAFNEHIIAHEP